MAEKSRIALIMIDIDHFKPINDTYGHSVGDRVLARVENVLSKTVRSTDMLARYGGEEFILFLANVTTQDDAMELGERMRQRVSQDLSDNEPTIVAPTISLGIVVIDLAKETATLDELINRTDQALYRAKELGRNRVVLQSDAPFLVDGVMG